MDDVDCLGAKIISNVESCMRSDPEIDEYDILPVLTSTKNRSPVRLVDHKLGIESWGAKLMFCTAAKELMLYRQNQRKPSDSEKNWLCSRTLCVLLLVPDHSTAWNMRKELITRHQLSVKDDLYLAKLILTKHPKSSETFAHRRWLLANVLGGFRPSEPSSFRSMNPEGQCFHSKEMVNDLPEVDAKGSILMTASSGDSSNMQLPGHCRATFAQDGFTNAGFLESSNATPELQHSNERHSLVEQELLICHRAADRYHSNYYSWSHRIWVLQHVSCCCQQIISSELDLMHSFVWSHISDHSGFHYRQFLLKSSPSDKNILHLLDNELSLTSALISTYPGHEAAWYHRRFVLQRIAREKVVSSNFSSSTSMVKEDEAHGDTPPHIPKRTKLESAFSSDSLMSREMDWCRDLLEGCGAGGWQQTLVKNHLRWLNSSFGGKTLE